MDALIIGTVLATLWLALAIAIVEGCRGSRGPVGGRRRRRRNDAQDR